MASCQPAEPSVYSLVKQLTGGKVSRAYDLLLDLTGAFRANDEYRDVQVLYKDISTEMHLAGRNADASRLAEVYQSLLEDGVEHTILYTILLCTRNANKPLTPPHRKAFPTFLQPVVPSTIFAIRSKSSGLFAEPLGFDDLESSLPAPASSVLVPKISLEDWKHCMSDAAQFAISQEACWLNHKMGAGWRDEHHLGFQMSPKTVAPANGPMSLGRMCLTSKRRFLHYNPNETIAPNDTYFDTESLLLDAVFSAALTGLDASHWMSSEDTVTKPLVSAMLLGTNSLPAECSAALQNRMTAILYRSQAQRHLTSFSAGNAERAEYVARAQHCGSVYQDVLSFAEAYAFASTGRVLESIANYAHNVIHAYFSALMRVIDDESSSPDYKAWSLVLAAEHHVADMCLIANIFSDIEDTDGSCCAVINVVLDHSQVHSGNEAVHDALDMSLIPYMDYVWDWVLNASSSRDILANFFGSKLGVAVTASECLAAWDLDMDSTSRDGDNVAVYPNIFTFEQALFVLRAGRNRALLRQIAPWQAVETLRPPHLAYRIRDIDYHRFLEDLNQFANHVTELHHSRSANSVSSRSLEEHIATELPKEMNLVQKVERDSLAAPSDRCHSVPKNVFQIPGREQQCDPVSRENDDHSVFRYDESPRNSRGKGVQKYTQSEWPPPNFLYGQIMLEPLRKIDDVVQQDLLRFFINDLDIYGHLRNLRSHVLLGAGDFASVLVEQINLASRTTEENEKFIQRRVTAAMTFYGTAGAGGKSFRDRTHLTRCLQTALNVYNSSNNPLTEFLSLDSTYVEGSSKTALWDSTMNLKYAAEYPLNLILSDQAMSMYSTFFGFFLRVLRVQRSLRNLFMASRRNSVLQRTLRETRNSVLSDRRLRAFLWQFCWQAQHFVNVFGGFAFDQALGASWNDFEKSWASVSSIWDLRDTHMHYLSDSLKRCLLGEKHKTILGLINGGFDIVVNLDNETSSKCSADSYCTASELSDLSDLLTSASASLRRRTSFLIDILERLLENGSHPHLETLLPQLKFNVYYQQSGSPLSATT